MQSRRKLIYSLIFLVLYPGYGNSVNQHIDIDDQLIQFESTLPGLLQKYKVPGAAVAFIQNDGIACTCGYGFADKQNGIIITNQTVFQAASISKPVTAWAVMKLVESGRLDLDTPVEKYLTRWFLPPSEFDHYGVTIRRILSHTAGLSLGGFPGFDPQTKIPALEAALAGENSSQAAVQIFKEPGSEFDYSGGGYMLLSLIVEEVTGEQFEDYIRREVLLPLGMVNSGYAWTEKLRQSTAIAYDKFGMPRPNYLFSSKGAASLYTTAGDLARFLAAHWPGPAGEPIGRGILKPESIALMTAPATPLVGDINLFFDKMGLGYFIDEQARLIAHSGSNRGWRNIFALHPETGDGIIVLTNSDNGRNLYVDLLGQWSRQIGIPTPKICRFYTRIFRISASLAAVLLAGLAAFVLAGIRSHSCRQRTFLFRNPSLPAARILFRILFRILLPLILLFIWSLLFQPLLADLSPLTAGWFIAGISGWTIMAMLTGLYPKLEE